MRVITENSRLLIVLEDDDGIQSLQEWSRGHVDQAFQVSLSEASDSLEFQAIGNLMELKREPINVHYGKQTGEFRLLSNLAETSFELDGRHYSSVEGFWQGLKFFSKSDRERLAGMFGFEACFTGREKGWGDCFLYEGETYRAGSRESWELMRKACVAKFTQHMAARNALRSTGTRPLVHRTSEDSWSIPGWVFAHILTEIRECMGNEPLQ